eukprot:GABW01001461.1.p1 GENE.GABW01001461.1~~GABW01001461.1.p1  ORF type:complete len:127 (-),score=22.70 GABW01001461.1:79-459(-)
MGSDDNGTSADPFVKYEFDEETGRTRTIKKTLEPSWNHCEDFEDIQQMHHKIKLEVYDDDRMGDDLIGTVEVPIDDLVPLRELRSGCLWNHRVRLSLSLPGCQTSGFRLWRPESYQAVMRLILCVR